MRRALGLLSLVIVLALTGCKVPPGSENLGPYHNLGPDRSGGY
jgi:hypothetical protein